MPAEREGTARARYSFARNGGAIGDIVLAGDSIPAGAVVRELLIKVETPLTSAGGNAGTVAIKVQSAADLQEAKAVSGAPWSTTGAKLGTLVATSAPITTTARRSIVATVAAQALTAGKFSVYVRYLLPKA